MRWDHEVKTDEAAPKAGEASTATIKTVGREVFFYGDVTREAMYTLIEQLRAVDLATSYLDAEMKVPIRLHVNSYGGEVMAALGVADQIPMLRSPVQSVVVGCAASAATLISMACDRRLITPSSFMLIHQIRSFHWGTFAEFQDEMNILNMLMDKLATFYVHRSRLTTERVREIMQRDTWFDAEQALEAGLVDQILRV